MQHGRRTTTWTLRVPPPRALWASANERRGDATAGAQISRCSWAQPMTPQAPHGSNMRGQPCCHANQHAIQRNTPEASVQQRRHILVEDLALAGAGAIDAVERVRAVAPDHNLIRCSRFRTKRHKHVRDATRCEHLLGSKHDCLIVSGVQSCCLLPQGAPHRTNTGKPAGRRFAQGIWWEPMPWW